jgi:hypothetical protein
VRVEPKDAYGEVDPERVLKFPASQAPEGLKQGMQVGGAAAGLAGPGSRHPGYTPAAQQQRCRRPPAAPSCAAAPRTLPACLPSPRPQVQLSNGMVATVTSMDSDNLTLDLNHELAGKWLNFDVEMLKHCPADRMATVSFGAGCFWGPELVGGRRI